MKLSTEILKKLDSIVDACVKQGILYFIFHYVGIANADTTGKAITRYHKVTLGWKKDGYHFFLNDNGLIEDLEPVGTRVNGCKATGKSWYNPFSKIPSNEEYIGVKALQMCFETTKGYSMNELQEMVLMTLSKKLIEKIPNILIGGHREFPDYANYNKRQNTLCPGYSVEHQLEKYGIEDKNIFYRSWKP